MGQLELIVKKARNLPVLPQVTSKLLDVINDSKAEAKDVGKIIESDQSLATQLLKQVNSLCFEDFLVLDMLAKQGRSLMM